VPLFKPSSPPDEPFQTSIFFVIKALVKKTISWLNHPFFVPKSSQKSFSAIALSHLSRIEQAFAACSQPWEFCPS
jgi:endoglucanase Acf2